MTPGEWFGIAIGMVGLVGTVAAAIDARRSGTRIEKLSTHGELAAKEARDAAQESRAAAASVETAVEAVRLLADDLGVASRAARIARLRECVRLIAVRADLAMPSRVPVADDVYEPFDWFAVAREIEALSEPLTQAGRLLLPKCWRLHEILRGVLDALNPAPPSIEPEGRQYASVEELRSIISAASAAFAETSRPPDQIPLGVPRPIAEGQ